MAAFNWNMLCREEAAGAVAALDLAPLRRVDPHWQTVTADSLAQDLRADRYVLLLHRDAGFALLAPYATETGALGMYGYALVSRDRAATQEFFAYVDALAAAAGVAELRFGTHRRGWDKIALRFGYNKQPEGEFLRQVA